MFTPQQIDQISFSKAKFGGYNMQQVDEFLEPLTEDYVTLYKENALLKSKMRILVGKLEEYRKNEASVKEAVANAQATADKMIQEAESKCAAIAASAPVATAPIAPAADALIEAENARVEEARKAANARINEIQEQMKACIQALERIKSAGTSVAKAPAAVDVFDGDEVAQQISKNMEALVGTTEDTAPVAAPKHPTHESTTSRFTGMNLQFGSNYTPNGN